MTQRFVYVAYPIDQNAGNSFYAKVEWAKTELLKSGTDLIFDPGDAFSIRQDATPGPEIARINRMAANVMATGVLAFLPMNVASVGVPMEIRDALAGDKWLAIVTDLADTSWMLADMPGSKPTARRPEPRIQFFNLDASGILSAVHWLNSHEGTPYEPTAHYLPVQVMYKAECGQDEPHEPHVDGHYQDEIRYCRGAVNLLPSKTYPNDAGFDLVVAADTLIQPNEFVDVDLGIGIQLEDYQFGRITGRSSTLRKRGLLVNEGIIDAGYRGRLFAGVFNLTDKEVAVCRGERIAQLLVHSTSSMQVMPVPHLLESERGSNGFGSSGA